MDVVITISALIAGLCLMAGMIWLERRPRSTIMPSLLPTTPLMFAGVLIALMALAHMMTLYGIESPKR